jgi:hypothetical protein
MKSKFIVTIKSDSILCRRKVFRENDPTGVMFTIY